MRGRSPSPSGLSYAFGPGGISPAVKWLIIANVVMFVLGWFSGEVQTWLGMQPAAAVGQGQLWRLATYMFLHSRAGFGHILFNMLSLWMFGVELERMWGTAFFTRYYLVCGVGAALFTILASFFPGEIGARLYDALTIGASGAIFGILLAYGMYFPDRQILFQFLFPIPAKYFVILYGAISLFLAVSGGGGGVAHFAHLGGLLVGWLYLRGRRMRLAAEIQYQFARWRINRARRRFDVHPGGRDDRPRYH